MKKDNPEARIKTKIKTKLEQLGWLVVVTHGNLYQFGLPDLYIAHRKYGTRWVEVKNPLKYEFTPAQKELFHKFASQEVGIWVLTSDSDSEINKIFGPANWYWFLKG